MLKNILKRIKIFWFNKVKNTTREWDEDDSKEELEVSRYCIVVKASLLNRLKFVFTNHLVYRLTKHQFDVIHKDPLKNGKN